MTKPKEPRGRVRFLDEQERDALLEACRNNSNPYLLPVFVLALSDGMRRGEIMNLRWEDVDFFKSRIILHETKKGDRRVVPLSGYAHELLIEFRNCTGRDVGLLFPSKANPTKSMDLRHPWNKAKKEAGIDDYT